jgi:hypothetical protein
MFSFSFITPLMVETPFAPDHVALQAVLLRRLPPA